MFGFGVVVLVVSSIRSILFLKTADIERASCFAKFSKPVWFFDPCRVLNSSTRDLFLVISVIFYMNKQKYMQIFSLQLLLSASSESSNCKLAISVKHLIASILEDAGPKKLLIMIGINSVSNM